MENKDIGYLRKSYDKSKLNLADVNFQPMEFFKLWFDDALNNKNIEEANAMTLTTLGLDNYPKEELFYLSPLQKKGLFFILIIKVKREYQSLTIQKLDYRFFGLRWRDKS